MKRGGGHGEGRRQVKAGKGEMSDQVRSRGREEGNTRQTNLKMEKVKVKKR